MRAWLRTGRMLSRQPVLTQAAMGNPSRRALTGLPWAFALCNYKQATPRDYENPSFATWYEPARKQ